jgi:hypothetical protein
MLDASIRDVFETLPNTDKTSVLINAMEHLPIHVECVQCDSTARLARTF